VFLQTEMDMLGPGCSLGLETVSKRFFSSLSLVSIPSLQRLGIVGYAGVYPATP